MSYTEDDMRSIILDLADKAEPLEAAALREVAANYKPKPKQERFPDLTAKQTMLLAALVYLVWTPIFYWLAFGFPKEVQPPGSVVEQLTGFYPTPDGRWKTRTFRFAPKEDFSTGERKFVFTPDPVPLVVYEDLKPLPATRYEFQEISPHNIWRFVTIKSDNDPNKNGHRYYAVQP